MSIDSYSQKDVVDATHRPYQAKCVAYLLKGAGETWHDQGVDGLMLDDLGDLLIRLVDQPLEILNELRSNLDSVR